MPKSRNRHAQPPFDPTTGVEVTRYLDELGREVLDETPMAPPIGYTRTPSLAEQIRAMVQSEKLRQMVEESGHDTFEEADDFDVGDDFDPDSPYEEHFDPLPPPTPSGGAQAPVDASEGPPEGPGETSPGSS